MPSGHQPTMITKSFGADTFYGPLVLFQTPAMTINKSFKQGRFLKIRNLRNTALLIQNKRCDFAAFVHHKDWLNSAAQL